jgi:DNA-binding NarL/FixJ family response regulator
MFYVLKLNFTVYFQNVLFLGELTNGFETTRKISEQYPSVKIIGFPMHTELSYCRDFLELGAKGYLVKIGQPSEIIEAIEEVNKGNIYICKQLRGKLKHP